MSLEDLNYPPEGCDAEAPSVYLTGGKITCRCLVCGRCGHHTGDSNQGHFWSMCSVTGELREPHFCCPGSCELEEVGP